MPEPPIDPEQAMIAALLAPLAAGLAGAFGLTDDAALLSPPPGQDLVVTLDTLNEGVHFLFDGSPEEARAIAAKALAVNVSDLAAKGASPYAYLLSLALSEGYRGWLPAFVAGLADAQARFGLALAGGDTTRIDGGLSVSITAIGLVPAGQMVRRSTARPGDIIYVSGTIGDAVLGLDIRRGAGLSVALGGVLEPEEVAGLLARHLRPEPRLALAPVLRQCQAAAMDVSDGLVIDLDRLCRASQTGARIESSAVPHSTAGARAVAADLITRARLLTGGDDYEILAAVRADQAAAFEAAAAVAGVRVTAIGAMTAGPSVDVCDPSGAPMAFSSRGFVHVQP